MRDTLFRRRHGRASRFRRSIREGVRIRASGPRILANSIPKAGTHLLARCLDHFPGMVDSGVHIRPSVGAYELEGMLLGLSRGSFATAHLPFSRRRAEVLAELDVGLTLIIRDPRDVVVSHFHYVTRRATKHPLQAYYRALSDEPTRLMASIQGVDAAATGVDRGLENVGERFRRYLRWRKHACCVVRFRDLIGPRGGGSRDRQVEAIERLAAHLGLEAKRGDVDRVVERAFFDKSTTFRRGAIGDWVNHFTEGHKEAFKEVAGQLLIDLGYEGDMDW